MIKLIFTSKEVYANKFTPRDVRNAFGSHAKEGRVKELIMWHKNETPKVVYGKPFSKKFCIYVLNDDMEVIQELMHIAKKDGFTVNGNKIENIYQEIVSFKFQKLNQMIEYKTRTPIVYARNEHTLKVVDAIIGRNKDNKESLKKELKPLVIDELKKSIVDSVFATNGQKISTNDIDIDFDDFEAFPIAYKDKRLPAVKPNTIRVNGITPNFIGYKIGLGYGEIFIN